MVDPSAKTMNMADLFRRGVISPNMIAGDCAANAIWIFLQTRGTIHYPPKFSRVFFNQIVKTDNASSHVSQNLFLSTKTFGYDSVVRPYRRFSRSEQNCTNVSCKYIVYIFSFTFAVLCDISYVKNSLLNSSPSPVLSPQSPYGDWNVFMHLLITILGRKMRAKLGHNAVPPTMHLRFPWWESVSRLGISQPWAQRKWYRSLPNRDLSRNSCRSLISYPGPRPSNSLSKNGRNSNGINRKHM